MIQEKSQVSAWETDAKLFGQLETNHKPYLAMLCARSVQPSKRGQVGRGRSENSDQKTTAARFAKAASITDKTVAAYIKVWDAMAKDGVVIARADLVPGVDVELPDAVTWRRYYRQVHQVKTDIKTTTTEVKKTASLAKVPETPKATTAKVSDAPDLHVMVGQLLAMLPQVQPTKSSLPAYDRVKVIASKLAELTGQSMDGATSLGKLALVRDGDR
jgi:hypothetical protein